MPTIVGHNSTHQPKLIDYINRTFKPPKLYERLASERFVGVSTAGFSNLDYGAELDTNTGLYSGGRRMNVLSLDYPRYSTQLETRGYDCGLEAMLEVLHLEHHEKVKKMAWLKQREARTHKRTEKDSNGNIIRERETIYRDGLRQYVTPVVAIFYRLEDDFPNLIGNHEQFKRVIYAGAQYMSVQVGRFDVRIHSLTPRGSAPSFEFYVFDDDCHVTRIIGRDLYSYMKVKLADMAKDFLGDIDVEHIEETWLARYWESFSPDEVDIIKKVTANNAHIIRLLYNELTEYLMSIDKHIITSRGLIPKSVASAGERIALAQADSDDVWTTPDKWAMQIAALTQAGPRVQARKMGSIQDATYLDQKSQHAWIQTQIPGPNSRIITRIGMQPFDISKWIGKHALFQARGIAFNRYYPAIRTHDMHAKRLRYIQGSFDYEWFTSYEAVVGILDGSLQVEYIYDGLEVTGDPDKSYMSRGAKLQYSQKEKHEEGSAKYLLTKTLAVAPVGKKAETNKDHRDLDELLKYSHIPKEAQKDFKVLENAFMLGREEFRKEVNQSFKQAQHPHDIIDFNEAFENRINYHTRAGVYYDPVTSALVYGFSSAMIGLAARCTHAAVTNTDMIIVEGDYSEGMQRFYQLMEQAGFPVPKSGMGSFEVKMDQAHGAIANGGLYYLTGRRINRTTGEVTVETKHADHGLQYTDGRSVEQLINDYITLGRVTYTTRPHPIRLLESLARDIEPGTLIVGENTLTRHAEPFITLDEQGNRIWREYQRNSTSHEAVEFSSRILQEANRYLANSVLKSIPPESRATISPRFKTTLSKNDST